MESRPHVALLTTALDLSGAEQALALAADGLADAGYRVSVLGLQRRSGALAGAIRHPDIVVTDFAASGRLDVGLPGRLTRWLVRERVTVLYTFLFHAHIVGRWAARRAGVPRLISSQQYTGWGTLWHRTLERWTGRWCDCVVAVSNSVRDDLINGLGVAPQRVRVIPNAIDVAAVVARERPFDPTRADRRIVIGSASRLVPERDHASLVLGFKRALLRAPNLRLRLAGTGPLAERIQALVVEQNLEGSAELLGQVADPLRFHDSLDLYVQPSRSEGLPYAVIEAMAMQRPVIATDVAGNRDIVVGRETGWLIPPGSPEAWEQALIEAVSDPARAVAYGQAGRQRALAHFDVTALRRATVELVDGLVGRRT